MDYKKVSKYDRLGEYYGYPKCCIDSFKRREKSEIQLNVSRNTGFIPCIVCATKVYNKEITLEDLIKNRKCETVFPSSKCADSVIYSRTVQAQIQLKYDRLGEYYGYPKCCIDSFKRREKSEIQINVGKNTGFIPCIVCATKVYNKEITLEDLIKNRKCETVFPFSTRSKSLCVNVTHNPVCPKN